MMWRNVSFVDNIELHFAGNVVTQSMDLGDVDNDGENELVVGNIDGDLAIFKGDSNMPVAKCPGPLGMITCVRIGDIFNTGKNYLVCLTAEGWCEIFDVKARPVELDDSKEDDSRGAGMATRVHSFYTQNLPANSRALLLADVDGDGLIEMAVTYCDRVVRTFRWQPEGEYTPGSNSNLPPSGQLGLVDKWQLAGQIGAVTMDRRVDGTPELLVSQPGRTYVTLLSGTAPRLDITPPTEGEEVRSPSFVFHPLGHNRVRNKDVSTVIVGGIRRGKGCNATYHALASLDGTLVLVEKDKILWSLQVDHRLFVLDKLDVTGNGQEEVVCCSWDGQTYIVNHSREVVRYHFKENVAAFVTGYYGVPGRGNVPCFVYATFKNQLYIHYGIHLPCVESASLLRVMEKRDSTHQLMDKLGVDATKPDAVRNLYHWMLYGWRPSS